jgi:phosphoribosyl 1,2-cyclic phosphodiesterase
VLARFWGTRGSLPVALKGEAVRGKLARALVMASGRRFSDDAEALAFLDAELTFSERATYGGATSCVELEASASSFFICDMGSGLREFGLSAMGRCAKGGARRYNFFLSHLHWDHIMGFPFFVPAFDADAEIIIHAGHADAEQALRRQQEEISFPVAFDWLRAKIRFETLEPGRGYDIDGIEVQAMAQHHSHASYGYRFTDGNGRSIVYSTDSEHKTDRMDAEEAFVRFFGQSDLVICDTMYSLADAVSLKEDWGHSSNLVAVDLCHQAKAQRLALFHHEPTYSDEDIERMYRETIRYEELTRIGTALEVLCAYDGLEVSV